MMERPKCEKFIKEKDSTFLLKKALALIEHPITKCDVERHKKVLNHCLIVSHDGFYAKELVDVTKLIDHLKESDFYQKPLWSILQLCTIPPKLTKSSDLLLYNDDIVEYFSWLGCLLVWTLGKPIQSTVVQIIHDLLSKNFRNHKNYLPLTVRRERAQRGKLTDVLGEILDLVDENIYPLILDISGFLLHGCPEVCNSFLRQNAVNKIVIRLEPTWQKRLPDIKPPFPNSQQSVANLDTALTVLHILLKYPTRENPIMLAPTRFMLWSLQWAFRLCAIKERRALERNNILAILIMLLDIFPDALSGNTTFAYDIANIAVESIFSGNNGYWSNKIKLTTSSEDHKCMALLLVCMSYFSNCLSGAKIIEECRVMVGLVKLISNEQQIPWNSLQRCFLLDLVLSIFIHLLPCAIDEFLEDGGPYCLLRVIRKSQEVGYNIVSNCLDVLNRFSRHNSCVKDSIRYNKGLFIVKELAKDLIETGSINHEKQNCLKSVFNFLRQFCETNSEVLNTLPLTMAYMKRYVNPANEDPIQDPKLIIFVLNFVWVHFAKSNEFCDEFIKMDGVYLLLDISQMSHFTIKLVALGALVDLCEVAECIPYLITWRSACDGGQGIISLLMEIFRSENKDLEVKTGQNGEILDSMLPIMGKVQFYETFCMCSKASGCASIADLFLSCRPKVYCLVQILNNLKRETVDIANDFYQLYNEKLSVEDEITLLVADNFLALKQSEQWTELLKELELCGSVLTLDKVVLETMIEVTHKWGSSLRKMQLMVSNKSHTEECAKERNFYKLLREARLPEALEALSRIKYIARCSERLFRISSNLTVRNQIEKCLEHENEGRKLHRTLISNLSVNVSVALSFVGVFPKASYVQCQHSQSVSVPSDVFSLVEVKNDFRLVSPQPSESFNHFVPIDECSSNHNLKSEYADCNEPEVK